MSQAEKERTYEEVKTMLERLDPVAFDAIDNLICAMARCDELVECRKEAKS